MAGGEEAQTSSSQAQRGGRGDRGGSRGQRRGRPGRGRGQRQPQGSNATERPANAAAQPDGTSQQTETGGESSRRKRNPRNRRGGGQKQGARGAHGPPVPGGNRAFGGRLTTEDDDDASESAGPSTALSLSGDAPEFVPGQPVNARQKPEARPRPQNREKPPKSTAQDLGTRIHEDISSRNYECAICTDDVTRSSQTWSCSLCWTVVHLKCVKRWYENQKKQKKELQSGQPQQDLSWRCPGCNSQLVDDPGSYHCWCGKDINPRPASGALPPHSCGQTCFKPRPTCPHPCSLQCHAGPCPPCDLMGPEQPCFCGKNGSQKRCRETDYENGWSCQEICGDLLPCGEHFCSKPCHSGLCGDCSVPVESRCFCGQVEKELSCFEREDPQDSYDAEKKLWFEASFTCGRTCARKFDCEFHSCSESCHAQDELPAHCPYSPDVVSHCPCGKTPLEKILSEPRQSCRDVVPHCDELCGKKLKCGHACQAKCHVGDCGGCDEYIDITCRCGRTTSNSMCHQGQLERPWCMRICQAKLSCGRHTCGEHCCSGEKTAAERQAAKRKHKAPSEVLTVEAEHICIKTCGRPLKCGSHNCQQMCHRGPCGSCPEAIFHEISCDCGRTILQPPQPCGTLAPDCRFPCTRRPGCGHPPVEHSCHSDDITCPKCPFLVDKLCACGKERLHSQPCHLQEPRCGRPCGKKLKCGLHNCKKLCHRQGECEAEGSASKHCGQTCGKKKMFCDHACQNTCHGQTPCNESAPCPAKATVTCPCGLNKQEVKCQASSSNPTPARPELKCDDECLRQERNRRLATALNIDPNTHQDDHVPYADTTLRLFQDHTSWAESQEREFRVFASSAKEGVLRYKPMPSHQRQFLHALAEDYGLESASEDVEPYRYVVVYKSPRFVSAPGKTLAQCVKIRAAQAASAAASSSAASSKPHTPAPAKSPDPYNALLLTSPRFGLTIEEVHQALDAAFASQPSLHLKIDFLPTDEVAVRAAAQYSALVDPGATEEALAALKPRVAEAAAASKLAAKVMLCHVGADQAVTRREDFARPDAGGWSAVAGRAASRREAPGADPSSSSLAGDAAPAKGAGKKKVLLGLRRKKPAEGGGGASGWASKLDGDVEC